MEIQLPANKKVYFASDFHLGAPNPAASREREKLILQWLEQAEKDAQHIFLVGDIFDFWFEYKHVIPKGYTRILGKLASMSDKGIGISVFIGNHDMWMNGYFEDELNIPVYYEPQTYTIGSKRFYVGHGDGLGPGDHGYKMLKKVFRNPFCRWLFSALHPAWGISLANYFSRKSRAATGQELEHFLGAENEWLAIYSKEVLQKEHFDYFIFGHRHLPLDISLKDNSRYIHLGFRLNGHFSEYTPYLDLQEGTFTDLPPHHSYHLDPVNSELTDKLFRCAAVEHLAAIAMNKERRRKLLYAYLEFFRLHIPDFTEMHSPPILHEILDA